MTLASLVLHPTLAALRSCRVKWDGPSRTSGVILRGWLWWRQRAEVRLDEWEWQVRPTRDAAWHSAPDVLVAWIDRQCGRSVMPVVCTRCSEDLPLTHRDGYRDGDWCLCPGCGAACHIFLDDTGAYVGRWWCEHGRDDETQCGECEDEEQGLSDRMNTVTPKEISK